jgi:hypothetical protein
VFKRAFDGHAFAVLHRGCRQSGIHGERLQPCLRTGLVGEREKLLGHFRLMAGVGLSAQDGERGEQQGEGKESAPKQSHTSIG